MGVCRHRGRRPRGGAGRYAVVDGVAYTCLQYVDGSPTWLRTRHDSPGPAGFNADPVGGWRRRVLPEEITELIEVTTTARWRDAPVVDGPVRAGLYGDVTAAFTVRTTARWPSSLSAGSVPSHCRVRQSPIRTRGRAAARRPVGSPDALRPALVLRLVMGSDARVDATLQVRPLSADTWLAFDAMVQRHNGIFGGCWCTYFHPDDPERRPGAEGSREMKKRCVEAGVAHAALVMDGEEAIAWAQYGTVIELPNIHHRKQYDAEKDGDPDYRITCVFVDRRYRRQGITELAIAGALDLIAKDGGGLVEAYPHDLTHQTKKMSSSFLYNGTRRLYERLGFRYVRPKGLKNCVMSIEVPAQ